MPAGGGACQDDFFDSPFCGPGANQANGPRRIMEHNRVAIAVRTEPVIAHKRFESPQLEDPGETFSLLRGQHAITAARQDHHGRVVEAFPKWLVNIESGDVFGRVMSREVERIGCRVESSACELTFGMGLKRVVDF